MFLIWLHMVNMESFLIRLLSKDALNWSKVTVKICIMLNLFQINTVLLNSNNSLKILGKCFQS